MPSRKLRTPNLAVDLPPDEHGRITAEADVPDNPGWRVMVRLAPQLGAYVVDEVKVFAPDGIEVPPGGITQQVLRRLPLQAIKDDLGRSVKFAKGGDLLLDRFAGPDAARAMRRQAAQHPRRAGRDDRYYAEIAAAYVRECATSRSPVVDLARRLRLASVTVRDAVAEARRRDLLTKAGKGRAGGELTEHAREILKGDR